MWLDGQFHNVGISKNMKGWAYLGLCIFHSFRAVDSNMNVRVQIHALEVRIYMQAVVKPHKVRSYQYASVVIRTLTGLAMEACIFKIIKRSSVGKQYC